MISPPPTPTPPQSSTASSAPSMESTANPSNRTSTSSMVTCAQSAMQSPMAIEPVVVQPTTSLSAPMKKTRGKKRAKEDMSLSTASLARSGERRPIAPLRSRRMKITPLAPPIQTSSALPNSRESSPGIENIASSPIKRARTGSMSGEIHNFSIFPSSDDEMEGVDCIPSPSTRLRARFNQLLGPSPLQKSYSSTAVPQHENVQHEAMASMPNLERAITTPISMAESPKIRTRAKTLLSKVDKVDMDDVNAEMSKVFMLVCGKGMGMGSSSAARGFRRGSGLRPRDEETMDLD